MPSFQTNWLRNTSLRPFHRLAFLAFLIWTTGAAFCQDGKKAAPVVSGTSSRLIPAIPMAFEENDGQLPAGLSFVGRAQSYSVAIEPDRLRFLLPGSGAASTVDVRFAGSRGGVPVSLSGIAYRSNYFIGPDSSKWRQGVANFSRVGVRSVYPGIDTEFYEKNGELEHDFVIAPGADAGLVRLDLRGVQQVRLTDEGDAIIPASTGEIRFRKPVAYQFDADGRRVAVDAAYRLSGKSLRFGLGSYDHSRTLVIDPVIVFATYVAGDAGSTPAQMATDGNGTLFIAGSTTSTTTSFPPASVPVVNNSGTGAKVFVAAVKTSQLGSVLQWISFLGSSGTSTATSVAFANATTLFVGGTTNASGFPGIGAGSFGGNFSTKASVSGFVSNLNAGTGALAGSTYIASSGKSPTIADTTTVSALAADSGGNAYIAGFGLGVDLTSVAQLGPASGANSIVPAAPGTTNNAFVIKLDSQLKTPALVTYLQSKLAGDYEATAIQIDNNNPINIYVAGTVGGESTVQFPTAQSFTSAGAYDATKDYTPCTRNAANTSVFVAQIQQPTGAATNSILGFSMFTCADTSSGKETARGLAVGANGLYLVGDTVSPDLAAGIEYSNTGTTKTTASPSVGLQAAFATGNLNGYAIHVPITGAAVGAPSAFTFLGGTSAGGDTTVYSVAMDATNKLVQLAGQTAATRATIFGFGAPGLPPAGTGSQQDLSGDSKRAFLYTFEDTTSPAPLTSAALKSISYLGNATTGSQAVSVQPDIVGAGAYVLVQDTAGASGFSYTSADAAGAATPSKTNAYLADIQGTNVAATAPGLTLSVDNTNDPIQVDGSSCTDELACVIGFNSATDNSTILFTWLLTAPTAEADNVVLNFPQVDALASSGSLAYTIQMDGSASGLTCVSKLNNNGTTCALNDPLPASATPHKITLEAKAGPGANTLAGQATPTFTFDANAADAQAEFSHAAQNPVTAAKPVSITLTLDQDHGIIDASNGTGDTGSGAHITQVLYSAKVQNTSANDSPNTSLKMTPPATAAYYFVPGSESATIDGAAVAGCQADGSGCTKVDVPAGKTLIYSFKVQYLAAGLSATVAGPTPEQLSASAKALPLTANNTKQNASVTTQVNGYAALSIAITPPTPPGGTAYPNAVTAFNLGAGIDPAALAPTPLVYTITVSNTGPNAAGVATAGANSLSLANALPQGFRAASTNPVSTTGTNGGTATCESATSCSNLYLPMNATVTITIRGGFFDSATPDAAPIAAVSSTQTNHAVTDQATLTVPTGTFDPNAPNLTSSPVTVQRLVHLRFSLATTGTQAIGVAAPSSYNLSNTNKVNYNYTIQNTGPDFAINVPLTNTFNPPVSYPTPPAGYVQLPALPSGVTCGPPATNFSSCKVASLAPGSNTVAFGYLFPDNAPASTYPVTTEVSAVSISAKSEAYGYTTTSAAYGNAVDSDPVGTAGGQNQANTSVTIYRSNHLVLTLANSGTASKSGASPAGYDLGTAVKYSYKLVNDGPNYAINVPLADLLQITTPGTYVVPPNAYTITAPTSGTVVCSASPLFQNCGVANVAPSTGSPSQFDVNVTYPDNTPASPTVQDVSAVPSNINTALYTYSANLNNAYGNAIDTGVGSASDASASSPTYLYRTASIAIDTVSVPVNGPGPNCAGGATPCLYMANSTNTQDTAAYTVKITNNGPNIATQAQIAYALPNHFVVPSSLVPGLDPTKLTCAASPGLPNNQVCKGFIPVGTATASLSSQFDTTTVPADLSFTNTNTPPNTPGSAQVSGQTGVIFAFGGTVAPTTLPTVNVDRATHLVTAKLVAAAPGDISPSTVAAVNLDEKVPGDAQGRNDLVQVTLQVGNAGLNDAVSVSVMDPLPPYFILTQKPANCSVPNGTPVDSFGNPITTNVAVVLTCTIATVPAGTGVAASGGHHGTVTGAFAQIVYAGKFQDNGLQTDIVSGCAGPAKLPECGPSPNPEAIAVLQFGRAKAQSRDGLDLGDLANAGDSTSAAPTPLPIQRAAHLHFTLTQYVQPGDAPLNPVGGVAGPGIAESQLGASGSSVINPVRYQVRVVNDGPNIATGPVVSTTLPLNPGGAATRFVNVSQSIEPSSTPGFPTVPSSCATGQVCTDAGMIATGASVLYNVDGNFDINTLVEGNSGARAFGSVVTSSGVIDSNPAATAGGDQQTSLPITVVNTPAGSNFTLAPFAGNLAQPLNLKLGTVQVAGITGLAVSGSSAPPLPSGPSPNPPDNGATVPLYRFGQGGVFYALGTTASVPSASTNQTMVCLNSIPETFQKPERVLLWALSNAPTGTTFGTIPHYTSSGSAGDITTLVLPQGGGSYSVPAASTSYPPPGAQPQPAEVCGVVNGLADAANPTMLAVLEPVNFAPYVRTAVTAANSSNSQPGKGVTAAAAQVDLTISPQNNYDYNDADPCYTGSGGTTRSSCDDNVQMTTFLFGGGNLIGDAQQVHTYFYGDIQATPKPQFNLPAGQPQLYLVLADQLGAQGYKEMTSGGNNQVCDPGNPSAAYTPTTPACPLPNPLPSGIAVPPAQTILPLPDDTSVKVALLTGNVGFGGSTGLIPLPQVPTPEAVANVTAGQTAGFSWNWLTERPEVQGAGGGTPPVLTLACVSADGTDLAAKGIQCNIPQTYSYSTGSGNNLIITAPPAIYVVTTGNTTVGALQEAPFSHDLRIVAAIVFPIGAIPLVLLLRRRRALKATGWLAVLLFASIVGLSIGCGSSGFEKQQGTTSTGTPAATYQFVVTATGTASDGSQINIKSYPFAVTVSAVH